MAEDDEAGFERELFSISVARNSPMPPSLDMAESVELLFLRYGMPAAFGVAPSAATTMLKFFPAARLFWICLQTSSMSNGCSGMRITSAPPASPP